MKLRLLLSACLAIPQLALAATTLSIIPSNPVRNEPVYVRVQSNDGNLTDVTFKEQFSYIVSKSNGGFRLLALSGPLGVPPPGGPVDYTFYIGDYSGNLFERNQQSESTTVEPFAQVSFEVDLASARIS